MPDNAARTMQQRCRREDGTSVKNKRSPRRMFLQVLSIWNAPRKSGTAQSEAFSACFTEIHEPLV